MGDANTKPEIVQLSDAARALVKGLPANFRPNALEQEYPRILNKMAELWKRPAQLDAYFEGLLVDTRGGRQGFSLSVLFDITSLKDYYQTEVYPRTAAPGTWDPRNRV